MVDEGDIKRCDEIINNNKIQFKFVSIYLIGKEGNLSVGAPFCRFSPSRTFLIIDNSHHRIKGPTMSLYDLSLYDQITNITSIEQTIEKSRNDSHEWNTPPTEFTNGLGCT